jgi:hypothetical protein
MSTRVEVLHIPMARDAAEKTRAVHVAVDADVRRESPLDAFAAEQVTRLVHQVFFPASGKSRKQIVFSAVDEGVDVGGVCMHVAETLSNRLSERVGIVEAHAWSRDAGIHPERRSPSERVGIAPIRAASNQLSSNLWSVSGPVFWGGDAHAGSPAWVRERLGELRTEFDYSVLHAPAAGVYSGTSLLAQASDGLVLVIEANYTRRAGAQKAKELLHAANVRVLGTILTGRTFPIPEGIYRRL